MNDIRAILDEAAVVRLREHYDNQVLLDAAARALSAPYAPAAGWVSYQFEQFFAAGSRAIAPRDRQCALLALQVEAPARLLAIHVYWSLAEGLFPAEIAEILLLASTYRGIHRWAHAVEVLSESLTVLAEQLPTDPSTAACIGALSVHWR